MPVIAVAKAQQSVADAVVDDIIFLLRLQIQLSLDVITRRTIKDERTLQGVQIIVDGICAGLPSMARQITADATARNGIADIVREKTKHMRKERRVAHSTPFHDVFQQDRMINPRQKEFDRLILLRQPGNRRQAAVSQVLRESSVPILFALGQEIHVLAKGQRQHLNLHIASR